MMAEHIIRILTSRPLVMSTERQLQDDVEQLLTEASCDFRREVRLSPRDRIDFVVDRVGIELKTKGGKRAILRQIERYADSAALTDIILFSSIAMGLPESINGKPLHHVSLGRAWL